MANAYLAEIKAEVLKLARMPEFAIPTLILPAVGGRRIVRMEGVCASGGAQHVLDRVDRHVLGDEGFADTPCQDEGQLAVLHLLVLRHMVDQGVRRQFAGDLFGALDVGGGDGQATGVASEAPVKRMLLRRGAR